MMKTKALMVAVAMSVTGNAMAGGSYYSCPCSITHVRISQLDDKAVFYFSGTGPRQNVPSCVDLNSDLGAGFAVDTKLYPGIFTTLLSAYASGASLDFVEGQDMCGFYPDVEDLNQIVVRH